MFLGSIGVYRNHDRPIRPLPPGHRPLSRGVCLVPLPEGIGVYRGSNPGIDPYPCSDRGLSLFYQTHQASIVFANGGGGGGRTPPRPPRFLALANGRGGRKKALNPKIPNPKNPEPKKTRTLKHPKAEKRPKTLNPKKP